MIDINSVIQSDCFELMKEIPDKFVDCIITSPPYNMNLRIDNNKFIKKNDKNIITNKYKFFSDNLTIEEYYEFHKNCLNEMLRISSLIFYNVSIVSGSKNAIFRLIGNFNKDIKDIIIWDKINSQPAMNPNVLNRQYEMILILENPQSNGRAFKTKYFKRGCLNDVWKIKKGASIKNHSATFPIELVEKILVNFTKEGDIVLDPFAGTSTTALGCINLNRKYIMIEKQTEYVNLSKERIRKFIQNKPISIDF